MLGTIGSFIAYPIVGHALSEGLQKVGDWALRNSGKLLSSLKASGRASLSVIKTGAKIRSYQDLRTSYLRYYRENFREINREVSSNVEKFKKKIIKGYEKRIDTISRKVGSRSNFARQVVKGAIKGEVKFLPMTYVMYKVEQIQGNIPADQNFLNYYATTGLPLSLGFSAGFDVAKRSLKMARIATFSKKSSVFGLEALAKLGAESLHNLNKMTKGMFAVYDNAMSKFVSANQTFKAFGSTTAALKAIGRSVQQVNARKARRSDLSIVDAKVKDAEFKDKTSLYDSYATLMGDERAPVSSVKKESGRRTVKGQLLYRDIATGEGRELERVGFNKKFAEVHRGLRKLAGAKYYGDDIGYMGTKVIRKSPVQRSENLEIITTDVVRQVTQDRAKIDFLGGRYDIGVFHIDSIRDAMDKIVTQFLNIANRPWLNFLDAGNHWLQSAKTKALTHGIQPGKGVVGLQGGRTLELYTFARNDEKLVEEYNKSGSKVSAAKRAIQIMTKAEESVAESYLKAKQEKAIEYARITGKWGAFGADKGDEEAVKEFVADKIAFGVMTRGQWDLGSGDILDVLGRYVKVHTKLADGNKVTFILHAGDAPIEGAKLLRGDTRAGQIAGGLLGGKASITGPSGVEIESGIETTTNIKMKRYYRDSENTGFTKFVTTLGDFLEWNSGHEQSLFGKVRSIFGKYKDPSYIGKVVGDLKRGALNREKLEDILRKGDTEAVEIVKGINSYSKKIINGIFASMRAADMAEGAVDPSKSMTGMLLKVFDVIAKSNRISAQDRAVLGAFDIRKAVIDEKDGLIDVLNKIKYTNEFFSRHEGYLKEVHGFDESPLRQLQELVLSSKDRTRASALSASLKGHGDRIDKHNKEIFDFLLSISSSDRFTRDSVARVLSEVSSYGAGRVSSAKLRLGETNMNGISAAIHMLTVGNKYVPGESVDALTRSELAESIEFLSGTFLGSGRANLREAISTFGSKKRIKEAPGAENKIVLVFDDTSKKMGVRKSNLILKGTEVDVREVPINRREIEHLAAVGTMNSALSILGLGFDLQNTFTVSDIITKTLAKRVLPVGLLFGAHDLVTSLIQQTPLLKETSLAGGVTGILWDAYAGARVLSQTVSDFTGITSFAQKMEELVPGSIDSPLSGLIRGLLPIGMGLKIGNMGRVGPIKGGMIGAGIGMILGGGPLGLFDDSWNLAKGREQVIAELSGEKEVAVSKGRFWELSGSAFWGDKITYFRPSLYALQKKQYQRADNYIGNDLVDVVQSYIDPGVYAEKHYISRPYEMVGGKFSNLPLIGTALNSLVGGSRYMHQDFLQEMSQSALLAGGAVPGLQYSGTLNSITPISSGRGAFYGGEIVGGRSISSLPIISPDSIGAATDTTIDNMLDVAGLRGFVLGNVIDMATDRGPTGFSGGFRIESANDIASFSKAYWEKELGGIVGLSEGIRRIFPNPSPGDTERVNRIANAMPLWLPGKDSFIDFLTGDPYNKIQMGEVRLPGKAYEATHDVYYTYPIDSMVMGKSFEEQVSFYAGDVTYLASLRRNWHVVERTRKELIGELKKTMPIIKESDVAYDVKNDVHSFVDAVMQDEKGLKTAIAVVPIIDNYVDPGGVAQLNAYLVNNTKDIKQGLLIAMDKDGNISKQIIYADLKKYLNDVKLAKSAARQASKITKDIQEEGYSVNRWPAYSHLNRLQILVNVAPFSKETQLEMKIVHQQIDAGILGNKEMAMYRNIMDQFIKRLKSRKTQEYKFIPLLMGKTPMGTEAIKLREEAEKYSKPEQLIGAVGEYITHFRNPILNKLMGKKSMYEQYREDIALGKGFTRWQNPIEDYIAANISLIAAEEDPLQATVSGATGGFIFGGPIGAGLGAGIAGAASLLGLTSNTRASRMQELDDVQALADALKYKEATELADEYEARDRRFTLRKKSSAYYAYTEGAYLGEVAGFNDVTGSLSPAERSYVRRMMLNMHKEDIEKIAPLLPAHTRGLFLSYATGEVPDTSIYQKYITDARRVVEGAPLRFRSDDIIYKTLQTRGLDAHELGLGWTQQVNRVKYMENVRGMDIPTLDEDPGYPGFIPKFGSVVRL